MGGFADAMTRFLMMGLAAMATLAIIGSFTTMTSRTDSSPIWERMSPNTDTSAMNGSEAAVSNDSAPDNNADSGNSSTASAAVNIPAPPPTPAERAALWLEVIAYVLIAIAALLAVIALVLMRSFGHQRAVD